MKTRLLIIGIAVILAGSLTVVFSQQAEIECLRLYKDINEISRTPEMLLAEREIIELHRSLIFEYVEKDCPDFHDLKDIYIHYNQNMLESEPETYPPIEPDTGEFRYGLEECKFIDENGNTVSCMVEGWIKPATELDCKGICKPPGGIR